MTLGEKATLTISAYVNYITVSSMYTANIPLYAVITVTVKSELVPTLFTLLSAIPSRDVASHASCTHVYYASAYSREHPGIANGRMSCSVIQTNVFRYKRLVHETTRNE